MLRRAALLLAAGLCATRAAACDYPGPPPDSFEAISSGSGITWAGFSDATDAYDPGVLGDTWEARGLRARAGTAGPCDLVVILPADRVFEDDGPRLADLDGDGANEIIVVETSLTRGASLAVYGLRNGRLEKLAATPHIGRTHRWLAPIGAADLDGDGSIEIAFVDRPHLAKILRVWRYDPAGPSLTEVAAVSGFTNHRIGDTAILGGIKDCSVLPEMVVATHDWARLVSVSWDGTGFATRDLGRNTPGAALRANNCP